MDKLSKPDLLRATEGKITLAKVETSVDVAYEDGNYTFSFTPTHDISKNGLIFIKLPKECRVSNPSTTSNGCRPLEGLENTLRC